MDVAIGPTLGACIVMAVIVIGAVWLARRGRS